MDITRLPKPPMFAASVAPTSELASTYSASEIFPFRTGYHGDRGAHENVYRVTEHVKVGFDDIFSEPRAVKSGDIGHVLAKPVRKVFSLVFQYSQAAVYYFLTIVAGVFLGLAWGALFGVTNYVIVWLVQPTLALFFVVTRIVAMPTRALVRALCDPPFQAAGQVFGSMSGRLRVKVFGADQSNGEIIGRMPPSKCSSTQSSYPQEWFGFV
ncbi:hypothetical protein NP493_459g01024 [Ridgeia piscesae]|uniref:Caveolin n=1 Tax=Ridgeia piscesae TaxID=27915 RepID=A0AAD9KYV1_RIDPI|nr:hypothetical protein NP493_459g01024 [Ridgeia piscesae]